MGRITLVIVMELVLIAVLLLRKDADDVPAFERLEWSTGVLGDVEAKCSTQPVGGGPSTVTFCGLELMFRGSLGRVNYPYGRLTYSEARERKNALLALRGRMLEMWLLSPDGEGTGRPVIWQLHEVGRWWSRTTRSPPTTPISTGTSVSRSVCRLVSCVSYGLWRHCGVDGTGSPCRTARITQGPLKQRNWDVKPQLSSLLL